ncbi:hypothetical protein NTD80_27770 [Pseudomonas sp. 13B_2.1_Bac1]|jgi:hypothetical protein|uniref:Uncharacterized protein n=1 Tax=Pseudomonas aylmerensis TaxID=1869229 RepID=A0A2T4FJ91_9PSED|nr:MULTISPECIES: hypothetical protein [Pseudomonas]AYF46181.1 hypothetical protein DXV65_00820 [Pseudomonas fluorescens]MBK5474526.1 hypothetical protein [Pseudomonas sp. TH21]MCU1786564.1 hypothetical protein [Pseudomonas sp. 13B_2.1_Bac1]OCW30122.1 hypothetical protein BBG20_01025 [Pseudomonas aylmerensis]PTC23470.1 hypothetical protein C9382_32150 [Pseudomonas aylmerensis]
MRRNEPWWVAIYLPCAFALALLFMSVFFQVAGYWLSGGEDVIGLVKENSLLYLKVAGVGFIAGWVLWFFNVR